jgi:hypothetical protein
MYVYTMKERIQLVFIVLYTVPSCTIHIKTFMQHIYFSLISPVLKSSTPHPQSLFLLLLLLLPILPPPFSSSFTPLSSQQEIARSCTH